MVTMHWVNHEKGDLGNILLHVFSPLPGTGVGPRIAEELFEFLQSLGCSALTKLQAIVSDNGSDAVAAAAHLRNQINEACGMDSLKEGCLIRCLDHTFQLAVKEALTFINIGTEKLRDLIKRIRGSKVKRRMYLEEAKLRQLTSKAPPCMDTPTRWNSTHEMICDSVSKRRILDYMAQNDEDLHEFFLTSEDWRRIRDIAEFLKPIRQIMEEGAAENLPTLSMNPAVYEFALNHCIRNEESVQRDVIKNAAVSFRTKLQSNKVNLVSDVSMFARYLDPRFAKPIDSEQLQLLKTFARK